MKNCDLILKDEYDFLSKNHLLGNNIIILGLGGSRAYGTNIDTPEYTSDFDIRGVALNSKRDILINNDWEQVVDENTDTVIYSFNKFLNLITKANPNTIELLGLRDEDYLYLNNIGKELLKNYQLFLSQLVVHTFAGYANSQLRRIENFLSANRYEQYKKEEHIFNSIKNSLYSTFQNYAPINFENHSELIDNMSLTKNVDETIKRLNNSFSNLFPVVNTDNNFKLFIDKSDKSDMDVEIFADMDLKHFPIRDFFDIYQDMACIINSFNKLGKRNTKKDDFHINKHAMHLVRLYLMAIDILKDEKIITYREKEHDLLMSIRNGAFMKEDGTFNSAFFDLINNFEKDFEEAAKNTSLPKVPDYEKINDFKASVNERIIKDSQELIQNFER